MHANFTVEGNPKRKKSWHYYYLYGLERACELNGVGRINEIHWYFQGASLILDQQRVVAGRADAWLQIAEVPAAIVLDDARLPVA